jgi:hypothetical protein
MRDAGDGKEMGKGDPATCVFSGGGIICAVGYHPSLLPTV